MYLAYFLTSGEALEWKAVFLNVMLIHTPRFDLMSRNRPQAVLVLCIWCQDTAEGCH